MEKTFFFIVGFVVCLFIYPFDRHYSSYGWGIAGYDAGSVENKQREEEHCLHQRAAEEEMHWGAAGSSRGHRASAAVAPGVGGV